LFQDIIGNTETQQRLIWKNVYEKNVNSNLRCTDFL